MRAHLNWNWLGSPCIVFFSEDNEVLRWIAISREEMQALIDSGCQDHGS